MKDIKNILRNYSNIIESIFQRTDTTESSYCPHLKDFLEKASDGNIDVILQPREDTLYPDLKVITKKENKTIGYIETKKPNTNLDNIEKTTQMQKYLKAFSNIILTDFLEFRLYRNGEKIKVATTNNLKDISELLDMFLSYRSQTITSVVRLSQELASKTRILHEVLKDEVRSDQNLKDLYNAFNRYLIMDLSEDDFADLYAQTITYSILVTKFYNPDKTFDRRNIIEYIPRSVGVLKDMIKYMSFEENPKRVDAIMDDIIEVVNNTPTESLKTKNQDFVFHFYETFLKEYDPERKIESGVFYTPAPIVKYIIESLNKILKVKFGFEEGLGSTSVTVLDPAAGTLNFLIEAIRKAIEEHINFYGDGALDGFIKEHILQNFYGFEIMMAPYVIGHIRAIMLLNEFGYRIGDGERFKLFLTNALDYHESPTQITLPGIKHLNEEAIQANKVKAQKILAIIGNPPYSRNSTVTEFIEKIMKDYKKELNEKTITSLSNDYIKFIRLAHWKMENQEKGIVAFITNNSYINGLIHRKMREELLKGFDKIYILNLNGDKRGVGLINEDDENVFDIIQGVAIMILVKTSNKPKQPEECRVYYYSIIGSRDIKYNFLENNDITTTPWVEVKPERPFYFFMPTEPANEKYKEFISLKTIFLEFGSGMLTGDDEKYVGFSKEEVANKNKTTPDDVRIQYYMHKPFDKRYLLYDEKLLQRARKDIMQNFYEENKQTSTKNNLGICFKRSTQYIGNTSAYIVENIVSKALTMSSTSVFPLYIYNGLTKEQNINKKIQKRLLEIYNTDITPEEIFYYTYAILNSKKYLNRYKNELYLDFARIPFTTNYKLFKSIAELGLRLAKIHLLKSDELNMPFAKITKGSGIVEDVRYQDGRVYINSDQYFYADGGIDEDIWNYKIGAHQVCKRWLVERKGRKLTNEEIITYCKILLAIKKTIEIQEAIDSVYDEVEEDFVRDVDDTSIFNLT